MLCDRKNQLKMRTLKDRQILLGTDLDLHDNLNYRNDFLVYKL